MDSSEIRLGVVDDHPIFRDGVRRTLTLEDDFKVIGEGESADDAIALCDKLRPDVMIIDMKMPGGGIKAVTEIHRHHPGIGIIVMTVEDLQDSISAALGAGARGYLLKGGVANELIDAVRVVSAGGTYVTPDLATALLFSSDAKPKQPKDKSPAFSERERQVFVLLRNGRSNKEIATELGLSVKTTKWYVSCVLNKLGVVSRLQVAIAAGYQDKDGLDVAAPRA